MRPLMVVLVAAALAVAGVAAYMVKRYLDTQSQVARATVPATATESVLVLARDVGAGATLIEDDLRYESWPKSLVDRRFVVRPSGGDDPKRQFVGAVARRALAVGEPLTGPAVFRQDEAGVLSGMLAPGMRAVSIALTPTNSVAGFAGPGDRVDVMLGLEFRNNGGGDKLHTAEVLLPDVRVLAIDARLKSEGPAPGKTATLEVTPQQAETLIAAGAMGSLYLVLRSMAQGSVVAESAPPFASSQTVSRAVRAIAGGGGFGVPEDIAPPIMADALSPRRGVRLNRAGNVAMQTFAN